MMKLTPHARSVADRWPTAKVNAAASQKDASAENMAHPSVALSANASPSAHSLPPFRQW
ncbi:MAG: hypothetical protein U0L52_00670 [Bacteroidaceae bacterium]|nr:hypothetical protein [Bacteroidaceae bacterium]